MQMPNSAESQSSSARKLENVAAAVAKIWEHSKPKIISRVDFLEQATLALLEGKLEEETRREAQREAHKLAGSLTTFGYPEGSRLAREIEQTFLGVSSLGQNHALRLSEQVLELQQELERPPAVQSLEQAPVDGAAKLLLVVDDDRQLTERLAIDAPAKGLRAEIVDSLASARAAIAHQRPDVVLLSLSISLVVEESLQLVAELSRCTPPVPVLVRSAEDSLAKRLDVVRSGGGGFLPRSLPPLQVLNAVTQALRTPATADTRVMVVDDDPVTLGIVDALLNSENVELKTLDDSLQFWSTLEATSPDLLVLDVDMPYANGIELCRVLRNDPHWTGLPVLFLTSHNDADTVARIFEAGADDYVSKPFVGEELISRVRNRLERTRLQRSIAELDPLTGLSNRNRSEATLKHWLALAETYRQPVCLGILEVDNLGDINTRHGHAAGDQVLRRLAQLLQGTLRNEDLVARGDGANFVVGMYGMDRDDGIQKLSEALETLRQEMFVGDDNQEWSVTFSAGVCRFPQDGSDLPALYQAAEKALRQAKGAGKGRVLPSGWEPGQNRSVQKVDVLLVDDDETLANLVVHALESRDYRVRWITDGLEAANALTGPDPQLAARLVLLDVDLPGLNGMGVLRRLAEGKLLQRTRVIMLTLRATEAEVLSTLEMGAIEHVGKPFNMPILMQRIRRALET